MSTNFNESLNKLRADLDKFDELLNNMVEISREMVGKETAIVTPFVYWLHKMSDDDDTDDEEVYERNCKVTMDEFVDGVAEELYTKFIKGGKKQNAICILYIDRLYTDNDSFVYSVSGLVEFGKEELLPIEVGENVKISDWGCNAEIPYAVICDKDIPYEATKDKEQFLTVIKGRIMEALKRADYLVQVYFTKK